jgi:hypothetical protein
MMTNIQTVADLSTDRDLKQIFAGQMPMHHLRDAAHQRIPMSGQTQPERVLKRLIAHEVLQKKIDRHLAGISIKVTLNVRPTRHNNSIPIKQLTPVQAPARHLTQQLAPEFFFEQ